MANGTPNSASITQTGVVGAGMAGGLIVLQYLVHPVWPPPDAVLYAVYGASAPAAHFVVRAIARKISSWSGEPEPDEPEVPVPPAPPIPPPPAPVAAAIAAPPQPIQQGQNA